MDREVAINLKTTMLVSQAAIPALTETRGCIVNFASIAYFEPQSPMAVYSAAKAAVAGFTQSLALELADRHVRVNAVAPGMTRTSDNVAAAGQARRLRRDGATSPTASWRWPRRGPTRPPATSGRSRRAPAA